MGRGSGARRHPRRARVCPKFQVFRSGPRLNRPGAWAAFPSRGAPAWRACSRPERTSSRWAGRNRRPNSRPSLPFAAHPECEASLFRVALLLKRPIPPRGFPSAFLRPSCPEPCQPLPSRWPFWAAHFSHCRLRRAGTAARGASGRGRGRRGRPGALGGRPGLVPMGWKSDCGAARGTPWFSRLLETPFLLLGCPDLSPLNWAPVVALGPPRPPLSRGPLSRGSPESDPSLVRGEGKRVFFLGGGRLKKARDLMAAGLRREGFARLECICFCNCVSTDVKLKANTRVTRPQVSALS